MEDISNHIYKLQVKKWLTDNEPSFAIDEYDCFTMPQFFIDIKSKAPIDYIRYVDWQRMVKDLFSTRKIIILYLNLKDFKVRYITPEETDKIDGRETWMFVFRKKQ